MNQILFKEQLSQDVYRMRVRAPLIAEERQPGQFIILQLDTEFGERIPLTIADADVAEGSITTDFPGGGQEHEAAGADGGGGEDRKPGGSAGQTDAHREIRDGGVRGRRDRGGAAVSDRPGDEGRRATS
jgi:ferredoxin/flavodoxin---NADP+ reductase